MSGVAAYGVLGWILDRWLHTGFLLPVGIVVGAAFGVYLTFCRFRQAVAFADTSDPKSGHPALPNRGRPRHDDDTPREETA